MVEVIAAMLVQQTHQQVSGGLRHVRSVLLDRGTVQSVVGQLSVVAPTKLLADDVH